MNRNLTKSALTLAGLMVAIGSSVADTSTLYPNADTFVRFGVNQTVNYGTLTYLDLYAYGTTRDYFGYVRFDLTSIPDGATITNASLTFTKVDGLSTRSDAITTGRFRVLGLNNVSGNTPQDWSETALTFDTRGAEWTAANTFDAARVTDFDGALGNETISGTASGSKASISGANLINFVSGFLADNAVTFIADQAGTDTGRGYGLASREYTTDPSFVPTLTLIYTIPEPTTISLVGLAGVAALAIKRRKQ